MSARPLPKSLQDTPSLDRWIALPRPGEVGLSVGKVEIGQGIVTALAQIAAEELDVALARLRVISGDTDAAPDEGMTTGSLSIEVSGAAVRIAAAEVRALFLAEAARRLNCAAADLAVADGTILRDGAATGLDYWTLAPAVPLDRPATGRVAPKPPGAQRIFDTSAQRIFDTSAQRIVGTGAQRISETSAQRIDLPEKLRGGGFLHDLALPGMLHARVLRQPRPDARLAGLDEAAIARAGATLFRHGNFAAVIAPAEHLAEAARAAARPLWEGAAPLHPAQQEAAWLVTQPATLTDYGDPPPFASSPGDTLAEAPGSRAAATYSRPYLEHAALGPSVGVAWLDRGHLTVWSHTQGVYPLRRTIAELLAIAPETVSVRHAHGAGCYGHNGADDAAIDAAVIAAAHPGRPIRVQWTRADEFGHEPVSTAMQVRIEAVLDPAGMPRDWTAEIWSAPHSARGNLAHTLARQALPDPPVPPPAQEIAPENGGGATRNAFPLYDLPARRVRLHLVQRPPVRCSALRGLGALANIFAIESFLDELADRAGADPLAYRLALQSDPRARAVMQTAAAMADWPSRGAAGSGVGVGLGFARYKNRSAYAAVVAEVQVDTEVRLRRVWCAADGGRIVNPDGARNQLDGGIVQAASWTLKEQVRLNEGGIANRSWADYPILRFSELPEIASVLIDRPEEPSLGMGECTIGPTAAAIGNAVAHALGARIRDLPLTRERIAAVLLAPAPPAG